MTKAYYKDAVGALLVYDISNKLSFESAKNKWLNEIREFCHEQVAVMLIGNKSDLKRAVLSSEAAEFAESAELDFVETSAQAGLNVDIALRRIIMLVARELPAIKAEIMSHNLPDGWLYCVKEKKFMNYWTGEITSNTPSAPADPGLCITTRHSLSPDTHFRDSSIR